MERKTLPVANHKPVISRETEQRRWAFVLKESRVDTYSGGGPGLLVAAIGAMLVFILAAAAVVSACGHGH